MASKKDLAALTIVNISPELIEVDINKNTGEYRVTFIPEGSTNPLARLTWKIFYQTSNDTFLPSYSVGLTTEGL